MGESKILSIVAVVVAGIVTLSEVVYYLSHQHRPGVSVHLIGLGAAVVCAALAQMAGSKPK